MPPTPLMIAVVYGRPYWPFVANAVEDLCAAVRFSQRASAEAVCLEEALASNRSYPYVERLYLLPFDAASAAEAAQKLARVFPNGRPLIPLAVQDLCWDKLDTQERLVSRGVPVPETLVTHDGREVQDFAKRHGFAILKQRFGCGGSGHWVIWQDGAGLMADNGYNAYRLDFSGGPERIAQDRLFLPPPYYVQKMIGTHAQGEFRPGQVLRAYVVDNEVRFWTERVRSVYRRPGDWIVNVSRGAHYRFLLSVSEQTEKTALRAARVLGAAVAAVDIIRTDATGPLVLEVDTDGYHMLIDRSFKDLPEYRDYFDLDNYIAALLAREELKLRPRALRPRRSQPTHRQPGRS